MASKEWRTKIIHGAAALGLALGSHFADSKPSFAKASDTKPVPADTQKNPDNLESSATPDSPTAPDIVRKVFLPEVVNTVIIHREASVDSPNALYATLAKWQKERTENPTTNYEYKLTLTKDIVLDQSFDVTITTTEVDQEEVVRKAALVLPPHISVYGETNTGAPITIFLEKQDIGIIAQDSTHVSLSNINIYHTVTRPTATKETPDGVKFADPSDFASIYITSKNGQVSLSNLSSNDLSQFDNSKFQDYSFAKIIGADFLTANTIHAENATWDILTIHDVGSAEINDVEVSRNSITALAGGSIVGVTASFTRDAGNLRISNVRANPAFKFFGIYRGFHEYNTDEGHHTENSKQVLVVTITDVEINKLFNEFPAWYLFTQTNPAGSVTLDNIQVTDRSYLQTILSVLTDGMSVTVKNSNIPIRHFKPNGDFFLSGSIGSDTGQVIPPKDKFSLSVQNSAVTLYEVPNLKSIPEGYDSYGLPKNSNVIQRLREAGFTVYLKSASGQTTDVLR